MLGMRSFGFAQDDKLWCFGRTEGAPQGLLVRFSALVITKCECILDAKGGPQDCLLAFRLISINPFCHNQPTPFSKVFFGGERRVRSLAGSTKHIAFWTPQAVRRTS